MPFKRRKPSKSEPSNQHYYKIILSHLVRMPSISNPSLNTIDYEDEDERNEERTPSLVLEENVRAQILEQFFKDNGLKKGDISAECIEQLVPIFRVMDENRFPISLSYIKHMETMDQTYLDRFEEYAPKYPIYRIANEKRSTEYRAISHCMYTIGFKAVIFQLFRAQDYDKLSEIFNLIALSHLIMGVSYDDMHMFIICQLKYLLTNNFVVDEQLGYYLYYAEITGNLYNKFWLYNLEKNKEVLHFQDNHARKNYRSMKVWKTLVLAVKKIIYKDLKRLDEYAHELSMHQDDKNHDLDDENCWLIRWLKKGYKHKLRQKHEFKKATITKLSSHNSCK